MAPWRRKSDAPFITRSPPKDSNIRGDSVALSGFSKEDEDTKLNALLPPDKAPPSLPVDPLEEDSERVVVYYLIEYQAERKKEREARDENDSAANPYL